MDIDFFKPVNDNHGHSAGDTVLKEMATRIANTIHDMDTSARWGGVKSLWCYARTQKYKRRRC
jgi:two-component system cell cycle response regulator